MRRNDDYHLMNENVIPVKTGIQKGLSLKIVSRIAQFRYPLLLANVVRPTLLSFWLACHAALDAASSLCFSGFLLPQE